MIRKIDAVNFHAMPQQAKKQIKQCNIKRGLKAASIYALSTVATYGILSACTSNKKQVVEPAQPKTEQIDIPKDTLQTKFKSKLAPNGYYVVKEGDTVWDIAKALLEEKGVEDITPPQIYKKELRIMHLNNLKFPSEYSDKVIIHEGESLCVDEHTRIYENLDSADLSKYTDKLANLTYRTLLYSGK